MTTTEIRTGNRTVEIKRADKDMFPDDGITKADLADYYRRVSRRILPHLRGRPLMLERYPDGIDDGRFMQKDTPEYFPDWVHRCELPKEDGTVTYPICDDLASLLYLVDQACITPHRWLSKADQPDHPDRLVFDLDPPGGDFAPVQEVAALLHELLDELGLPSGLMAHMAAALKLSPWRMRATMKVRNRTRIHRGGGYAQRSHHNTENGGGPRPSGTATRHGREAAHPQPGCARAGPHPLPHAGGRGGQHAGDDIKAAGQGSSLLRRPGRARGGRCSRLARRSGHRRCHSHPARPGKGR
ncbi:hypothetical protein ACFY2M_44620 [Streptomyces sp. NPDC001276]|uniref:non-homologous end-joining DNA ligase LigD n=1 Tax=Streptomyces sp. NPDC001276 TaxID=3364555 RepID=UPI0036BC8D1B